MRDHNVFENNAGGIEMEQRYVSYQANNTNDSLDHDNNIPPAISMDEYDSKMPDEKTPLLNSAQK